MNQTREAHLAARPLHVGWLVAEVRRRLDDPPVEIVLSVVTGYAAYLPAERLGVSAVVAAVTRACMWAGDLRRGLRRHRRPLPVQCDRLRHHGALTCPPGSTGLQLALVHDLPVVGQGLGELG